MTICVYIVKRPPTNLPVDDLAPNDLQNLEDFRLELEQFLNANYTSPTGDPWTQNPMFENMLQQALNSVANPPPGGAEPWILHPAPEVVPSAIWSVSDPAGGWDQGQSGIVAGIRREGAASNTMQSEENGQLVAHDYFVAVTHCESELRAAVGQSCGFTVRNDRCRSGVGVHLIFSHSRTRIMRIHTRLPLEEKPRQTSPVSWELVFGGAKVGRGESLDLQIDFHGDPPFVRAATWLTADRKPPRIKPVDPEQPLLSEVPPCYPASRSGDLQQFIASYDQEAAFVQAQASGDNDKKLFAMIDYRTTPRGTMPLQPGDPTEQEYLKVGAYLLFRVLQRGRCFAGGVPYEANPVVLKSLAPAIGKIAEVLEGVVIDTYSSNATSLDSSMVGEAFLRFGRGELLTFTSHGVPNGINYFCFPELALVVRQISEQQLPFAGHATFWRELEPYLGASAELFVNTFHQAGSGLSACSYRASAFDPSDPRRASNVAGDEAFLRWRDRDLADMLGMLVATALRNNMPEDPPQAFPLSFSWASTS